MLPIQPCEELIKGEVPESSVSKVKRVYRIDDSDHDEGWGRRGTKRKMGAGRGRGRRGGRGRKKHLSSERSDGRQLRLK